MLFSSANAAHDIGSQIGKLNMLLTNPASINDENAGFSLPVVDLGGLRSGDEAARSNVVSAIRAACLDKGFFYCVGHGVSPDLVARVFDCSKRFFALPMEEKLKLSMSQSKANRGYEPLRGQTLEAGAPPDLKEGYYIGMEVDANDERSKRFFNTGPNVWPHHIDEFREVMSEYYDDMRELTSYLLEGIALSLRLDASFFHALEVDPIATLRLLHYPVQPANPLPNEKGCGAHTDFGGITILLQDNVGGLQVWDHTRNIWLEAPPMPGAFVINLGDLIGRWTNDKYRSTIHRVINESGQERYSVPFFFLGNPQQRVECISSCLVPDEDPKYTSVTVDEHIRERYSTTYNRDIGIPNPVIGLAVRG
tara:strand:- start:464 stop:1558 length:1095 start_codon:yes stop_codon:yes gene_type:complete